MDLHMKGTFPLKRTNNVETTKEYSHKNPMYLNLCCEWTYYFRYSTMYEPIRFKLFLKIHQIG
jgi:hypothetical protein